MTALTANQLEVLATVEQYVDAPTARRVADRLETPGAYTRHWGYDRTYAVLKRMEKRGFVARDKRRPAHWSVTSAGYEVLLAPGEESL